MLRLLRRILAPWEDKVGAPTFFAEPREDLLARLHTDDPAVARELLEEAKRLNERVDSSLESVERRATTLQGVVSIAATVAVAGGALLLDPAKIDGLAWRLCFALLLTGFLYCLIATAYRATQSSTQIQVLTREDPADYVMRATRPALEVDLELSADMLYGFGKNSEVVRWKVSYLRAASDWFLRGLIFLGLIAAAFCLYVPLHGDGPPPGAKASALPPVSFDIDAQLDVHASRAHRQNP